MAYKEDDYLTFAIAELLTMNNIKLFGTTVQENIYNGMWNYGAALSLIMLLPVSYTHLDVYKRQRPTGIKTDVGNDFGNLSTGNAVLLCRLQMKYERIVCNTLTDK